MYPNVENMNAVLITKRIEIIMDIQVCPISRMNFEYKENDGKKGFSMIVVPITKRIKIVMSIQVCLISRMNFDYKENDGEKSFSSKLKSSISCILMGKT